VQRAYRRARQDRRGQPPALKVCLRFLRENDSLVVTTADRLARSTTDLLAIIADLDKRGIGLSERGDFAP
jgi:DNA invertase Pin-like site-specific DNA recombinase